MERTYSEYKAGLLSQTLVADYLSLPPELQAGAIQIARDAALGAGTAGDYADGADRYFSCQTCHMAATTALGCNKNNVPLRTDQPRHDLTGGNYWMPQDLANTGNVAFLADEGANILDAWINTGMAAPHVMATAVASTTPTTTAPATPTRCRKTTMATPRATSAIRTTTTTV